MSSPHLQFQKKPFDPLAIIERLLDYAHHGRLMVIMLVLGMLAGMAYYVYTTPLYSATSMVYLRSMKPPVGELDGLPSSTYLLRQSMVYTLTSDSLVLRAAQRLGLVGENAAHEDVETDFVPKVEVRVLDNTHLSITVYAFDPKVVRSFGEALVEAYRDFQTESYAKYRSKALELYAKDVEAIEAEFNAGLARIADFERDERLTEATMEQAGLLEIPKEIIKIEERLSRMKQVRARLEEVQVDLESSSGGAARERHLLTALSLLGAFEKERSIEVGDIVRRGSADGPVAEPAKNTNVVVQPSVVEPLETWREIEKQKRMLDEELLEASRNYLPDHVIMVSLSQKRSEMIRSLESEYQVMLTRFDLEESNLQDRLHGLKARMPDYYAVTDKVTRSTKEYSSLNKSQQLWETAFQNLRDRLSTLNFSREDREWADLQFLGHTNLRDKIPVSPNKKKLISMALLLGLVGAFGLPTVLNMMRTSASRFDSVEAAIGIPGVGIVPLSPKETLEEIHRSPAQGAAVPNFLLENFRLIRSHICLEPSSRDRSQVIMITSSRPREGKTTTAANVAWAFHSMGERTLLIDCDLRRGRVHDLTGVQNKPGMTHLLQGHCSVEEAVLPTANPLMDLIPRGPVIAGTTELLCQTGFEDLMQRFRKDYDRIIIDTPPVLGLSETSSLQRVVDGVLLVVRADATSMKDVRDAVTILRKSNAHFFGFVLNAVDLSKLSNYYSYYYYSSTYYDQLDPEHGSTPVAALPVGKSHRIV